VKLIFLEANSVMTPADFPSAIKNMLSNFFRSIVELASLILFCKMCFFRGNEELDDDKPSSNIERTLRELRLSVNLDGFLINKLTKMKIT
jgi:hypothetical protein